MGRRTERWRARAASHASQEKQREEQRRRRTSEEQREYLENILGTDRQFELEESQSQIAPFTDRFEIDETLLAAGAGHEKTAYPDIVRQPMRRLVAQKNTLMRQAEQAARQGDFGRAESLREKALGMQLQDLPNWHTGHTRGMWLDRIGSFQSFDVHEAINLQQDPYARGRGAAASPIGQTVGTVVRQGREFLDPDSETSTRFKESLTEEPLKVIEASREMAQRRLAQEHRASQRTARDMSLAAGSARNVYAERSVAARTSERFATEAANIETQAGAQRAAVLADAAKTFETYSRQFSMSSVQFAQAWLDNRSGLRADYQKALKDLSTTSAEVANRASQQHLVAMQESAKKAADDKAATQSIIGATVGLVLTIATAGIGAGLGAAGMAGLATAAEGAVAGAKVGALAGGLSGVSLGDY